MKTLHAYFTSIRQLIQDIPDVHIERYEEQILSADRANLRIRLRFVDQGLLEISEAFVLIAAVNGCGLSQCGLGRSDNSRQSAPLQLDATSG
jgi:hypothetical protein